jgi:hypothetical protein
MAFGAGSLMPAMAFEAGFLGGPEGGRVVGIVVDIVVAGRAGILQLLDVEPVGYGDIVRVDFRRGPLHLKDMGVAANAVWIDLVEFGRETCMLRSAFKGENVNAWHERVTGRMTLRAVDPGVEGRLLPEGRFLLLPVAGETEFLLRRRVGGQGDGGINNEYRHNAP